MLVVNDKIKKFFPLQLTTFYLLTTKTHRLGEGRVKRDGTSAGHKNVSDGPLPISQGSNSHLDFVHSFFRPLWFGRSYQKTAEKWHKKWVIWALWIHYHDIKNKQLSWMSDQLWQISLSLNKNILMLMFYSLERDVQTLLQSAVWPQIFVDQSVYAQLVGPKMCSHMALCGRVCIV